MTKLAVCADVHLGNHRRHGGPAEASLNRRCRQALDVLRAAVRTADKEGCEAGFVLGDLLDYPRPEAQLLAEVQEVLASARARWTLLLGNHEQTSTAPGDHALGPLGVEGVARVVEVPGLVRVDRVDVGLLPFRPGLPASSWLAEAVSAVFSGAGAGPRVLGVHLGVSDDRTPPWLRGAQDSVTAEELAAAARAAGVRWVFAGNWHDRRSWELDGVSVLQLGALVPTGWDNPGLVGYGTLAVWDDGCVSVLEVAGPRFLKVGAGDAERRAEEARAAGHTPYVQVTAPAEAVSAVAAALGEMGVLGEVQADPVEALAAARSAAVAARSAETLEEALAGFVREMSLPISVPVDGEDAFRAEVLRLSKGYLAAGED